MRLSREYWYVAALGGTLAAGALLFARPALLAGSAILWAWLLGRQYAFVRSVESDLDGLTIERAASEERIVVDSAVGLAFGASTSEPATVDLEIEPNVPAAADVRGPAILTIDTGERIAETTAELRWKVAGTFTFDPPVVTARDPGGMFETRSQRGPPITLEVVPRGPRNVHLGRGGDRLRRAYGEHDTVPIGTGLEPEELREYVIGDPAKFIDWKATARLSKAYVREFAIEDDRDVAILVDHRASMGDGPPGETKLDYARHVALSVIQYAQQTGDPVGLYATNDQGLTVATPPDNKTVRYTLLKTRLHDLTVADEERREPGVDERSPTDPQRIASLLAGDDSELAVRLRPFLTAPGTAQARIERDPLLSTVRTHLRRLQGSIWTVMITDDTNRREVRDAVTVASRGTNTVFVILTPTVLFEQDEITDLEEIYDRYASFESFRRALDGIHGVTAVELAPRNRIESVLTVGQRRRRVRS